MNKNTIRSKATTAGLVIILVMIILTTTIAPASADTYDKYAQYFYQYSHPGIVLCTQLTVRAEPSANASEICKLRNSQSIEIIGQYGEWYIIDLQSCGYTKNDRKYGFAKERLIKQDPYWIVLTQYTLMYATPKAVKCNGEQSGRVFFVIEDDYPFYAVQCKEGSPGTSFIYQGDIGQYSAPGQNLYVIVKDSVPVLDSPSVSEKQIKSIDMYTIVNVDSQVDTYAHVTVNIGKKSEFYGWVDTQYLQKIIN